MNACMRMVLMVGICTVVRDVELPALPPLSTLLLIGDFALATIQCVQ